MPSVQKKLFEARRSGCLIDVVVCLKMPDCSVNMRDSARWTPLMAAACSGRHEVVKYLLTLSVIESSMSPSTSVHHPASELLSRAIELVRVDATNKFGWTALHLASSRNHVDVVKLLCQAGSSVETKDTDGHTALHAAVTGGHIEVVQVLLSANANPTEPNKFGETPIDLAMQFERKSLELLLHSCVCVSLFLLQVNQ
eukprot:GHVR01077369.1.p1 GENE.GHVR01077369.1~~GHVR01077369.1.p1  ORF type:complete len:198 (+),score=42.47 GHVR01077369.1:5889-6482(+)